MYGKAYSVPILYMATIKLCWYKSNTPFPRFAILKMKYSAAVSSSRRKSRKVCALRLDTWDTAVSVLLPTQKGDRLFPGSLHCAIQRKEKAYECTSKSRPEEQVRGMAILCR